MCYKIPVASVSYKRQNQVLSSIAVLQAENMLYY